MQHEIKFNAMLDDLSERISNASIDDALEYIIKSSEDNYYSCKNFYSELKEARKKVNMPDSLFENAKKITIASGLLVCVAGDTLKLYKRSEQDTDDAD